MMTRVRSGADDESRHRTRGCAPAQITVSMILRTLRLVRLTQSSHVPVFFTAMSLAYLYLRWLALRGMIPHSRVNKVVSCLKNTKKKRENFVGTPRSP